VVIEMDKKDFNLLTIEKQINYINDLLKDNKSIISICEDIGIGRTTVRTRFKELNYKYNTNTKQYIKSSSKALIPKDNSSIINKVIPKHNKSKSEVAITKDDLLIKEVKELLDMKDDLKELIHYHNRNKNIVNVIEPVELKVDKDKFKGGLKGRLIKVYDNVNNDWIEFCKSNSQFKMQDLYSMALLDYIEKFKKEICG